MVPIQTDLSSGLVDGGARRLPDYWHTFQGLCDVNTSLLCQCSDHVIGMLSFGNSNGEKIPKVWHFLIVESSSSSQFVDFDLPFGF